MSSTSLDRRHLLWGLGALPAAAALAACTSDDEADAQAGSDSGGDSASDTRTVTDAMGTEVEVPASPQRVVSLHYAATQAALDLGVTPVGTADIGPGGTNNVAPNLVEAYEGMTIVTNQQEVDIEKLAELEPDLILATNVTEEDVLAQVKEIAPVYQFTLRGGKRKDWQNRVTEVADALNRAAEFDEVKVAWEKEIEDAATQYADVTDGVVVGVISSFTENNVYAWGEENMTGTFLMPLGFTWSEQENASVEGEEEAEKDMSQELIGDVVGDADILFYDSDLHETPSAYTEALRDSSLYQELPAVQAGHDYPIGKVTIAGFSDARVGLGLVTKALDDFGKA